MRGVVRAAFAAIVLLGIGAVSPALSYAQLSDVDTTITPDTPDLPDVDPADGSASADAAIDLPDADTAAEVSGAENTDPQESGEARSDDSESASIHHLSDPPAIERDAEGREYVADEVLVAASRAVLSEAASRGYRIISMVQLDGVDSQIARLLIPAHSSVEQAIAEFRQMAPRAVVSINNAYRPSQVSTRPTSRRPRPRASQANSGLVGVIDTGASPAPGRHDIVATRGFGSAGYAPQLHGSAVVSIVAQMGLRTQVADVFGPSRSGEPYATASAIISAVRWMVESGVPVINISIEGPPNPILEMVITNAAQSGHIVVAAAGNGGPLARPAYPGAYLGVIAVTAVDENGRVYLRANRGDYVAFAALGVDVPVQASASYQSVTGTSFAAPLVAARIAEELQAPSPGDAERALAALRMIAIDRGPPGRDPIYGWGEIRSQ